MTGGDCNVGPLVVILAAGQGTRAQIFGSWLHKGLLPLGDRPVLTRLLDRLPSHAHVVFAIGHLGDQLRSFVKLAHPDLHASFVQVERYSGPGTGPATSLLACRYLLNRPFTVTAIDAVYDETLPAPSGNWIGVADVNDPENWCTVRTDGSRVIDLAYRDPEGTSLAYTGTAHVFDVEPFLSGLETTVQDGEVVLDPGFLNLREHGLEIRRVAWRDAGNEQTYEAVRSTFGPETTAAGKTNDLTYLIGDRVLKLTSDPDIAEQLFVRGRALGDIAPAVYGCSGGVFASERIYGARVIDSFDPTEIRDCLEWVESRLWQQPKANLDPKQVRIAMRSMYIDKTLSRVAALLNRLPDLDEIQSINGVKCAGIHDLLKLVADDAAGVLSGAVVTPIHGDLHAENVLVDQSGTMRIIDWRTDFGGLADVGDLTYDLAKMIHTLEFSTPAMVEHRFSIDRFGDAVVLSHEGIRELAASRTAFWSFIRSRGYDETRIVIVDALVFLSMSPLYDDAIGEYLFLLGKVLLASAIGDTDRDGADLFEQLFPTR
jgi:choline kinase